MVTEPRLQRRHGANEGVSEYKYKGAMPKAGPVENSEAKKSVIGGEAWVIRAVRPHPVTRGCQYHLWFCYLGL